MGRPCRPGSAYSLGMTSRTSTLIMVVAALMTAGGAVVSALYIVQPWRSCSYADTSAGCAMLPQDAAVMSAAMLVTVIALLVLTVGVAARLLGHSAASRSADGSTPGRP